MYVQDIATMKSIATPPGGEEIIVGGYYTAADGGGGTFIWMTGTPPTQDGGIIILHNTLTTGWFQRIVNEPFYNVKWFGAKGNGTNNDTAYIQSALDSGAGRQVIFPGGVYQTDDTLNIHSNTVVTGESAVIELTEDDKNVIGMIGITDENDEVIPVTDVTISGLHLIGKHVASEIYLGNGIFVQRSTRIKIYDCTIEGVGDTTNNYGSGINIYLEVTHVDIVGNYILNGIGEANNSDILVYSASGNVNIIRNRCYSTNSQGIYVNAAGPVGQILVSENQCYNHTRHGISAGYADQVTVNTIIDDNLCINNLCTGIYVNTDCDGFIISNNIIDYCAGGGANAWNFSGSIAMIGKGAKNCSNNLISNTGYDTNGDPRGTDPVTAIRLNGSTIDNGQPTLIVNNIIRDSAGMGIHVYGNVSTVAIFDNEIIKYIGPAGIYAELASSIINQLDIKGNYINGSTYSAHGINIYNSATNTNNLQLKGNTIIGKKDNNDKAGIRLDCDTQGTLCENNISNCDFGLYIVSPDMPKRIGKNFIIYNNIINNSSKAVYSQPLTSATITAYGYGYNQNYYYDNTEDIYYY